MNKLVQFTALGRVARCIVEMYHDIEREVRFRGH
jgi:hypothetical protein